MELINCLMLTVCNRISLDSICHIVILSWRRHLFVHCDCHSLFIDNSDMTSPNSLIFLILVRVSQRHTLDAEALEWVKLIVSF